MIRRNRANIGIPNSLSKNECIQNRNSLIDEILSLDPLRIRIAKDSISAEYYRGKCINLTGEIIQDVAIAISAIYEDKCAFCESKEFHPDIEHYRPKKKVTGVIGHQGYYWLCYEWTNLLPSCSDCNDSKSTSFPLLDEHLRVFSPSFLIATRQLDINRNIISSSPLFDERPYLLHPEIDNPETCFEFNNVGEILGIDVFGRGEKTIEICDLNRKNLIYHRLEKINDCIDFCMDALEDNDDFRFIEVLRKIRTRALNSAREYTLLYKKIYNNFVELIIPLLPIQIQYRAEEVYLQNANPV